MSDHAYTTSRVVAFRKSWQAGFPQSDSVISDDKVEMVMSDFNNLSVIDASANFSEQSEERRLVARADGEQESASTNGQDPLILKVSSHWSIMLPWPPFFRAALRLGLRDRMSSGESSGVKLALAQSSAG